MSWLNMIKFLIQYLLFIKSQQYMDYTKKENTQHPGTLGYHKKMIWITLGFIAFLMVAPRFTYSSFLDIVLYITIIFLYTYYHHKHMQKAILDDYADYFLAILSMLPSIVIFAAIIISAINLKTDYQFWMFLYYLGYIYISY